MLKYMIKILYTAFTLVLIYAIIITAFLSGFFIFGGDDLKKITAVILCVCLIVAVLPIGWILSAARQPSYLFAIDAGHGGSDPGCIGFDGRHESNDTIKIANEVIALLKKQGQRTYLINRNLKTQERPIEANSIGADFLISLHRDSSKSSKSSGINIYTHEPSHTQRVQQPEKDYAPNERADKHAVDETLVNSLYNYLYGATAIPVSVPHYGSVSAPTWEDYYINRLSNMPSCIIEFGFATNPNDNAVFDSEYKTLAACVVKALMATVGIDYVGPFENSPVGSVYSQNGKNYYVINGEVAWNYSGEVECNDNIYTVSNGIAGTPLAPPGGKAGFTGNCKWLYYQNKTEIFGGTVMSDYNTYGSHPWSDAFSSLVIKDGVAVIGANSFKGCRSIETVVLPNSIKQIKDGAFAGCDKIKTVSYYGSKEEFKKISVGTENTYLTNAKILYICDLIGHDYNFECSSTCSVCGEKRETTHTYSSICDETCDVCGERRVTVHTYTADCDTNCNICMHKRETTLEHDFDENNVCKRCGTKKYIIGDLNGDSLVTDADAVYLLMYTFFSEDYPVFQPCDFNDDGNVTDADAVYLLMYTFFPEDYPI